jgi:hypothetical protein
MSFRMCVEVPNQPVVLISQPKQNIISKLPVAQPAASDAPVPDQVAVVVDNSKSTEVPTVINGEEPIVMKIKRKQK